jgi:hypothetical protein
MASPPPSRAYRAAASHRPPSPRSTHQLIILRLLGVAGRVVLVLLLVVVVVVVAVRVVAVLVGAR